MLPKCRGASNESLAKRPGPVLIYNMPQTTRMSLPLDTDSVRELPAHAGTLPIATLSAADPLPQAGIIAGNATTRAGLDSWPPQLGAGIVLAVVTRKLGRYAWPEALWQSAFHPHPTPSPVAKKARS